MFAITGVWLYVINAVAWVAIQLTVAHLSLRIPARRLDFRGWLFRTRGWERGGSVYQKLLRIRKWKSCLPSGGPAVGGDFSLARLGSRDPQYLARWVVESCRAEVTHWLAMAPVVIFLLWNPPVGMAVNVIYALAANLPCILVQRYNRPRLVTLLARAIDAEARPCGAES